MQMLVNGRGEGVERVRFDEIRGVRVLVIDLSGIQESTMLRREVDRGTRLLADEPPDSVLTLVLLEGVPYSLENVQILKEAAIQNRHFVRARAAVGIPEIARFSIRAIAQASGRRLESFLTIDEAVDWLAQQ